MPVLDPPVRIDLGHGRVALVDAADAALVGGYHWHASDSGRGAGYYARAYVDGKHVYMHRLIMAASDGMDVDHREHDTLDNRRGNLRVVTHAVNGANRRGAQRNNRSTGVLGVTIDTTNGRQVYKASISRLGHARVARFPLTTDGLSAASAWRDAQRAGMDAP